MGQLEVVKLSLVDGQRRQAPPEIGQISARRGVLYVLVEVSAPTETWDQASRQIVAKAIQAFAANKLGETTALQAAAEAVNEFLIARNKALPKQEHIWAGFNAAFIRDDQLYLAQAGPALTYISRGDSLTRFPKSFTDLRTGQREALTPLGQRGKVKCRLAHFALQAGDILTLAASHLPTLGTEETITEAVRGISPDAIAKTLVRLARHNDFSALLIQYTEKPEKATTTIAPKVATPSPKGHIDEQGWYEETWEEGWAQDEWAGAAKAPTEDEWEESPPSPTRKSRKEPEPTPPTRKPPSTRKEKASPAPEQKNPDPVVEPVTPSTRRTRRTTPRQEPEVVPSTARPVEAHKEEKKPPPPISAGLVPLFERSRTFASQSAAAARAQDWQRLLRLLGAGFIGMGAALLAALAGFIEWWRTTLLPRLGAITPSLDRVAHRSQEALYDLWEATKRVLYQLLPGDHPSPPPRVKTIIPSSDDGTGFLRTAVVIVPLIVLLAVALVSWSLQGSGSTAAAPSTGEYETLVMQAQALIVQAGNVDETSAQTLLQQANELLTQAEPLEAGTEHAGRVAALRAQAQQLMTRSSQIARPPSLLLATAAPTGDPMTLIHQAGALFALERSVASVYRVLPDPQSTVALQPPTAPLLSAQQRLGEGVLVGTPQFIVWVPGGGSRAYDALLMLTVEGQLFDFDPASGRLSVLIFAPIVADLKAADGYGGNLYLLDRSNRQIWKYVPDAAGQYSTPPQPWLNELGQSQLAAPIDMVIDGFIYVLDEQGEVARFQAGERKPFTLEPITPPLSQPVALAKVPPESTDLFVADSQRVVRFDQGGRFLVEYRAPLGEDWGAIRDIAVEAKGEILYILSSKGIYMVDIRNTRRAPLP